MEKRLRVLLEKLYREGQAHDQAQPDRLKRWRNLEPDTARLLALLVRVLAPVRALELGTSNGYSTLWLGEALRAVEGMLVSAESDPHRSELARRNLEAAGLEAHVELRVADAGELLAESADGEWDFILLDAERPAYAGYWPDLVRTLAPRGLLAVDNVISHASELTEFRRLVTDDPRVTDAVCPTGAGALLIARCDRAT